MPRRTIPHLAASLLGAATFVAPLAAQPTDSRPLGPAPARDTTAGAQRPAIPTAGGSGTLRTVVSLGAVLAVIFVGAALFRRFAAKHQSLAASLGTAGKSPAGIIEIIGRYPIGRGSSLVLLRLDKRVLLLSQTMGASGRGLIRTSAASLSTLCEVTDGDDVASILAKARDAEGDSMTAKFQSLLSGFSAETSESLPAETPPISPDAPPQPAVVVRAGAWVASRGGAA